MADFSDDLAVALVKPQVKAVLEAIFRGALQTQQLQNPVDRLVDVPEAAKMLGMSVAAVRKAASRGSIPCVRLGRRLRFRPAHLLSVVR